MDMDVVKVVMDSFHSEHNLNMPLHAVRFDHRCGGSICNFEQELLS